MSNPDGDRHVFEHHSAGLASSLSVAHLFMKVAADDGVSLDHLRLQKLCYVTHGWFCALAGIPLVREPVEAWKYGPVFADLYNHLKFFGSSSITLPEFEFATGVTEDSIRCSEAHRSQVRAFVERVWTVYQEFTGGQLVSLTHESNTPWHKVYHGKFNGDPPPHATIPNESIYQHYLSKAGAK